MVTITGKAKVEMSVGHLRGNDKPRQKAVCYFNILIVLRRQPG